LDNLAPIVLFVYNRLWHTRQTIEALQKNELADKSELFIYSDAPNSKAIEFDVEMVRKYIKSIDGFKKVTIIKRENNFGLAKNITDGVSDIVKRYKKVIVLEDDLVTSRYFLKFMNNALEFYENEKKVWHVSGWNYPVDKDGLDDVFLWRFMNCWGWATWVDRWNYFEKDIEKTIKEFKKEDIKRFNLDNSEDFFKQVILNKEKKIDTWAVFWYVSIFKKDGLCLNPLESFVENIGHDGSGVHCLKNEDYRVGLSQKDIINLRVKIEENSLALEKIKFFFKSKKRTFFTRVINKLFRTLTGKNIIK